METTKAIQKKLKSRQGATMVIALFFFIVCTIIGSIVLTSAYSTAGLFSHIRQEQQSYLNVSSAVRLVWEELDGSMSYESVRTRVTENGSETSNRIVYRFSGEYIDSIRKDKLSHICAEMAHEITKNRERGFPGAASEQVYIVSSDAPELENTKVTFNMDESYNLSIVAELEDGDGYKMELTFTAVSKTGIKRDSYSYIVNDGEENAEVVTVITEITTTTVNWPQGDLEKMGVDP